MSTKRMNKSIENLKKAGIPIAALLGPSSVQILSQKYPVSPNWNVISDLFASSPFSAMPHLFLPFHLSLEKKSQSLAKRRGGRAAGVTAGILDEDLAQDKKEWRKEEIEKERKIGDGQMEGRVK